MPRSSPTLYDIAASLFATMRFGLKMLAAIDGIFRYQGSDVQTKDIFAVFRLAPPVAPEVSHIRVLTNTV